eukprot:3357444-Rhodomonas_salina.1
MASKPVFHGGRVQDDSTESPREGPLEGGEPVQEGGAAVIPTEPPGLDSVLDEELKFLEEEAESPNFQRRDGDGVVRGGPEDEEPEIPRLDVDD